MDAFYRTLQQAGKWLSAVSSSTPKGAACTRVFYTRYGISQAATNRATALLPMGTVNTYFGKTPDFARRPY